MHHRVLSSKFAGTLMCFLLLTGMTSAGQSVAPAGEQDAVSIPQLINYQGFLTDGAGDPLEGNYDLAFGLFAAATGGTALWTESHAGVAVVGGVFNVLLGSEGPGPVIPDDGNCYLEVTVGSEVISPRARMVAVPYAYDAARTALAENADALGGVPAASYATQSWVNGQGFATQSWVTGQGYATQTWVSANDAGRSGVAASLYEGATPLSSKYAGITHAHSANDITSGTLPVARGGTGVTSLIANRILLGGTTVGQLAPGTGYLYWNGASYAWQTPSGGVAGVTASSPLFSSGGTNPNISLTGTVAVGNGGTGLSSVANNYLLRGTGGTALGTIAPGTGYLYWNGTAYAWQTPSSGVTSVTASAPLNSSGGANPNISLTGTVPVGNGGTGVTSLTANRILVGGATVGQIAPSTGYLYWNGASYAWQTPSGGVTGSGTANYGARWTGTTTLGNGALQDNGSAVAVGTAPLANYAVYGYNSNATSTFAGVYGYGYYYGVYGYGPNRTGVYGVSANSSGYGVAGYNSAGYGVYGYTNTSGYAGVYGYTPSGVGFSYCGVYGSGGATGVIGTGGLAPNNLWGVLGCNVLGASLAGVYGNGAAFGNSYGVHGYGGGAGVYGACSGSSTYGLLGSSGAIGTGAGAYGYANSASHYGVYGYNAAGYGVYGYGLAGYGAAYFQNTSGYYLKLLVTSNAMITNATKSCVITTRDGDRLMYCPEAPEVLFEDVGTARLVNGHCRVDLDPLLLDGCTIDATHPLRVYVTVRGTEPVPVSVQSGNSYFEVYGPDGSAVSFDWRIVASRKGFESNRLERFNLATE